MNAVDGHNKANRPKVLPALGLVALMAAMSAATVCAQDDGVQISNGGPRRGGLGAEPSQERFVPGSNQYAAGCVMELRGEATIVGAEVKLRQVCRWTDADKATFEPLGGLVIARIGPDTPFRGIGIDELKQTLSDAGVNLAVIRIAGATSCTVHRSDVRLDERTALQQWIEARESAATSTTMPAPGNSAAGVVVNPDAMSRSDAVRTAPAAQIREQAGMRDQAARGDVAHGDAVRQAVQASDAAAGLALGGASVIVPPHQTPTAPQPEPETHANRTLREMLIGDLAERLGVPVETLQVRFNPADDKIVNLAEPVFKFNVDGRRARQLGNVTWEVTVVSQGASHNLTVVADARAWEQQLVLMRPVAFKQIIRDDDLVERRVLVDMMPSETPATRSQVVGQMASREMKAGTVMTPRLVDAVPLVQFGQLVTVTLEQGSVQIRSVARAMESGTFGQTVKVRNDATGDVLQMVVVGPQEVKMTPVAAAPAAASEPGVASNSANNGNAPGAVPSMPPRVPPNVAAVDQP